MNRSITFLVLLLGPGCESEPVPPSVDPAESSSVEPVGLVAVRVGVLGDDGCMHPVTVEWPEEYWGSLLTDTCAENDTDTFFSRNGECYSVGGSCWAWRNDPQVEVCEYTMCCAPPGPGPQCY